MLEALLRYGNRMEIGLLNYGARMMYLRVPDRNDKLIDIIAGYDDPMLYKKAGFYYGTLCGRYANRIRNGRFSLNGIHYQLDQNLFPHHLHGGNDGFHSKIWRDQQLAEHAMCYNLYSQDGEMGYPGNLKIHFTYQIENEHELNLIYNAISDQDTIINLAFHAYFNLADSDSILDHLLFINADAITEIDSDCVPTGNYISVENTAFDFRKPKKIGKDLFNQEMQLQYGNGYDHNFILNNKGSMDVPAAILYSPESGIKMEIYTTQPGIQFYTCNWDKETDRGKSNKLYKNHSFVCLEPQHFPDSPNHEHFPSTVLLAGESYSHRSKFIFSVV
ncbi:MAG: galactose mutarotase [Saprospiraceae bacterium]|nr:galactose mutarotase [Saprospiraceae bacterium]